MKQPLRSLALLPLVLLVAAADQPQGKGDVVTVTRKETKLRSGKRLFASPVADLVEGDRLETQDKDGAWLNVKFHDYLGWVHETDVSANKEVRLSGEGVRENYSASEAAAARKGFNPQVERDYKASNPNLAAAFALVDKLQQTKVGEAEVRKFLLDGGLWQEGGK